MNQTQSTDGRRSRHDDRRTQLLEAAADYILSHGLQQLSVRPLAQALGLSHRTLLYHFGSKETLVVEVLELVRKRDGVRIAEATLAAAPGTAVELLRTAWTAFSAPERLPYIRLFHEVITLGLQGPPFDAWARQAVAGRVELIAEGLKVQGWPAARAQAASTLIVNAVRGLQLHLLLTNDRPGVQAAFEELVTALEIQLSAAPKHQDSSSEMPL